MRSLQSPALATRSRARPSRFVRTAQAEEEELAALPPFHARPVKYVAVLTSSTINACETLWLGRPALGEAPQCTLDPLARCVITRLSLWVC